MKLRPEPILIGLASLGPFVLAALIYFGPLGQNALPVVENPERELIARGSLPALQLTTAAGEPAEAPWASYRWALIYVDSSPCGEACRGELERLRQIHDALGADRHRVQRVFLHVGGPASKVSDPALLVGALDAPRQKTWRELFGIEPGGAVSRFFVADPLGNLVVAYPAGADRRAMLEDLERLLDVSRIG